jgi:toxin YoeB
MGGLHLLDQRTDDPQALNRVIEEAARDLATGIGKPERLSHNLSGYWSRRITDEHRLVCQLRDEELIIVQARYHY